MTEFIYNAVVFHVYDGDTIRVDIDQGFNHWMHRESIRLYGIDTPEMRGAEKEDGKRVRDLVREWLPVGSKVKLETLMDKTGKYGRTLGIIWPEGWTESINARLLREGNAEIESYTEAQEAMVYDKLGLVND